MDVKGLILKIVSESSLLQNPVMIDDTIPVPFEDVYDIVLSKGFLLFKKKGSKSDSR